MAEYATVRLAGARELDAMLKRLPKHLGERVLVNAVRAGAQVVRAEAKARAPVKTGRLRANIIARRAKGRGAAVTVSVGPSRKAWYGRLVEFGTVTTGARPFLRPAFESTKRAALDRIGERLGRNIERAAVKLAGPLAKSGLVRRRRRR